MMDRVNNRNGGRQIQDSACSKVAALREKILPTRAPHSLADGIVAIADAACRAVEGMDGVW